MMLTTMQRTHARSAHHQAATRRSSCPRATAAVVVCSAKQQPERGLAAAVRRCSTGVLSAALAASLVATAGPALLPPSAAAAPKAETDTLGAQRTQALIQEQGTPAAARPDTMKTNVPFQAPGINAPPRGPKQEQGSNVKTVVKDAARSIKKNAADPESKPFGISRGPLVRDAKKQRQPGNVGNLNKAGASRFKEQSADTRAAKGVEADPTKGDKRGIITGGWTTFFGGRNQ